MRSLARPLAAVTALHLGLLLVWSVVVPTFRGADEHVHHDLIRRLTETWAYPEYDELDVSRRTLDALGTSPAFPAHAGPVSREAATRRADRPGWADLGPDVRDGPPNQMPQHPPLYYESAAAVLRVLDGDGAAPLDRVVWQLRLLSILTLAPLPVIAADIARRFSRSASVVLAAAVGVLAVPQLTHVGATVSNDPLMILLGSLTLAGAARIATGDRRLGTAVATGVAVGLALFTKGFAVPLVPAVALACVLPVVAAWRTERPDSDPSSEVRASLGRALVVATLALALGGWWWIRNIVAYGTPQPGVRLRDRVPDVELDLLRFAGDFGERLVGSFWGTFGWREAHLPLGVSIALTVLVVVAVVAACWGHWARVVLVLPALVASAMVLSSGWGAFKKTGVPYATQGRYLFAGIAGLSVLVALGAHRLLRGRTTWQPLVTLAVALALQAGGLWIAMERYWAGSLEDRLRALGAFAPLPGPVTVGMFAMTALLVPATFAVLILAPRRPTPLQEH